MITIHDSRGAWPCPRAGELQKAGSEDWLEISEEHKDQLLNCLPPVYCPHGFYVPEPICDDPKTGAPVCSCVLTLRGADMTERHFLREIPRHRETRQHATLQLVQALHPGLVPEGGVS